MRRAAIKGPPGNRRPRPRHHAPTAGDLVNRQFTRPGTGSTVGHRHHRAPHPRRQGVLRCGAGCLHPPRRRLAHRPLTDRGTLDMAIRNPPQAQAWSSIPATGCNAPQGIHRPGPGSGLLSSMGSTGDCYDNAISNRSGAGSRRAAQAAALAYPPGTGQRPGRVPGRSSTTGVSGTPRWACSPRSNTNSASPPSP